MELTILLIVLSFSSVVKGKFFSCYTNTYLLLTEFEIRTVSYGPNVFPLISRLGRKLTGLSEDQFKVPYRPRKRV